MIYKTIVLLLHNHHVSEDLLEILMDYLLPSVEAIRAENRSVLQQIPNAWINRYKQLNSAVVNQAKGVILYTSGTYFQTESIELTLRAD